MCLGRLRRQKPKPVQQVPEDVLEERLNSKYPKATIVYDGRFLPNIGQLTVDVRGFFASPYDFQVSEIIQNFKGLVDDDLALECLKWVIKNIMYVSDKTEYGLEEFWCYPNEILTTKKGDCDDGAILLANLLVAAGVPYWKVRLTAGSVAEGGHCYVNYYVASRDVWVALDWCYHRSTEPVSERPDYKNESLYGEVWFSWNVKYAFSAGVKASSLKRELLKKVRLL